MRRVVLLAALSVTLFCVPVHAAEDVDTLAREREILQVDMLQQGLPDEAKQALDGVSPSAQADAADVLFDLLRWASRLSVGTLQDAVRTAAMLLASALVCSLAAQADGENMLLPLTGAVAAAAIFTGGMRSMTNLASDALYALDDYSKLLLPVMSGAAAASGAMTGAGALYMGSSLFFSVMTSAIRSVLLPLVYVFVAFAALECGLPGSRLGAVRQLLGWLIPTALKAVMYTFTAYLSITGLLSGSSDEAAVSAARSALSAAIPVVGSIAADASDAVIQSARVLRAAAGTFGVLAVCAVALVPFLQLLICYGVMKLTAAAAGITAGKTPAALCGQLAAATGYLVAMVGCAALMLLFSTCCLMQVAAG